MSMFNDFDWRNKKTELTCVENSTTVNCYARRFALGRWSFLGPGSGNTTDTVKPGGEWDRVAELIMNSLRESGHLHFSRNQRIGSRTISAGVVIPYSEKPVNWTEVNEEQREW